MKRLSDFKVVLDRVRVSISRNAKTLDFGCGAGAAIYALLDQGYANVSGYDISDYVKLRDPADRSRFHHTSPLKLRLPGVDPLSWTLFNDGIREVHDAPQSRRIPAGIPAEVERAGRLGSQS